MSASSSREKYTSRDYNVRVTSPETAPKAGSTDTDDREPQEGAGRHTTQRHAIYATETVGLLMIAVLLLVLTVVRYWHAIHWSLR